MSSEASHQEGFLTWFHHKFPDVVIWHTPNGEKRSLSVGIRLKKLGVTPGVPDLFIPEWKIFIEFKRKDGGTVSLKQKKMMAYLERVGYVCYVAYGAEDASRKVLNFLKEKEK